MKIWHLCGSGTSAVGAYLAAREKRILPKKNFQKGGRPQKQPGGFLKVMHATVSYQNGAVTKIEITGSV